MTVPKTETRALTNDIEVRKGGEGQSDVIVGYALKFNEESRDLGGFVEVIEPSALAGADMTDVRALFNHDYSNVLGRTKNGTLKLEVDDVGLRYEINPPETAFANDLMISMRRGDVDQSSFGFIVDRDGGEKWTKDEKRSGLYKRTISRFKKITDVSVVTVPAYDATESGVAQRSLQDYKHELDKQKEIDRLLQAFEF
jgi:uncharacterized protein